MADSSKRRRRVPQKRIDGGAVITALYLLLMLTVFLFCFGKNGYGSISSSKRVAFYAICGGYCVAIFLLVLESILLGKYSFREAVAFLRPKTITQWLFVLYLLHTAISAAASPYGGRTFLGGERSEGLLTIALYVCCFYFVSKFFAYRDWMPWVFAVSVTVFCLICIIQLQGVNIFGLYPQQFNYYDRNVKYAGEFIGTIGNVDFVSGFLCIVIPLLWVSCVKEVGCRRYTMLIPLLLAAYVLASIRVAAGYVGVITGVVLTLPLLPKVRKTRRIVALCVFACGIGALLTVYCADIGDGMLHEVHRLLHGHADDGAGSGRIYIWKSVLCRVPQRVMVGNGADTLAFADIPPFTRFDAASGKMIYAYIDAAHNELLNILYCQGLPAMLYFLGATAFLIFRGIRRAGCHVLTLSLTSAVIAYRVQAFFGISQLITAPFFWLAAGILENTLTKGGGTEKNDRIRDKSEKKGRTK